MADRQAQDSITVLGAGAWGTALALILAQKKSRVYLWEYSPEYVHILESLRENPKFLPGIKIPESIRITQDLDAAVADSRILVFAVPSQALRAVAGKIAETKVKAELIVSASKGIEQDSLCRMSEIIEQEFGPGLQICILSGPSHAEEVARNMPTSVVAAAKCEETARLVQEIFMTDFFRIYTSSDVVGVELGGALKNIIAIAAGIADGMGLGDNTKAALITRGLAEIRRLGQTLTAEPETFYGLSGIGDLIVTCTSQHSRNRRVGEELGRGRTLEDILANMDMVAEGVETTSAAKRLAEREKVEMPITFQMNRILFEGLMPQDAVKILMQRPRRAEIEMQCE